MLENELRNDTGQNKDITVGQEVDFLGNIPLVTVFLITINRLTVIVAEPNPICITYTILPKARKDLQV